jgi:hypothetical protein
MSRSLADAGQAVRKALRRIWRTLFGARGEPLTETELSPAFVTEVPNQPVTLYAGSLTVVRGPLRFEGTGEVRLAWFPDPRVTFELTYVRKGPPDFSPLEDVDVQLAELNAEASGYVTDRSEQLFGTSGGRLAGYLPQGVRFGETDSVHGVLFHLANFRPFIGKPISDSAGGLRAGRLDLHADGWVIRIDSLRTGTEIQSAVRATGGYAITHVGSVERADGSAFSFDEASSTLEVLRFFCSMVAGRFCEPILLAGLDDLGKTIGQQWRVWRTDPWSGAFSALSLNRPRDLAHLYEVMSVRWRYPDWRRAIRYAVSWYVRANDDSSSEARMIMAQVALELLAWIALVEEGGEAPERFDGRKAAQKLRKLLTKMAVPLKIPSRFSTVAAAAAQENWRDCCEAFTRARNEITHVSKRSRLSLTYEEALPELSEMGLWFVDLAILHFFKYSGKYVNRSDERLPTEDVPWT